jgi:hypothetical protein
MGRYKVFAALTLLLLYACAPAAAVVSQSPVVDSNSGVSSVDDNRLQKVATFVLIDNSSSGADEYSNEKIRIKTTGLVDVTVISPPGADSADQSYGFDITSAWSKGTMYVTLHEDRTQGRITVWGKGAEAYNSGTVTFYDDDDNSILGVVAQSFTVAHPAEDNIVVNTGSGTALPAAAGGGAGMSLAWVVFGLVVIIVIVVLVLKGANIIK